MLTIYKVDANYQRAITSCKECSSHEDVDTPHVCLVCDGTIIIDEEMIDNYPTWCPLAIMSAVSIDADKLEECPFCKSGVLRKIPSSKNIEYVACYSCGERVYKEQING